MNAIPGRFLTPEQTQRLKIVNSFDREVLIDAIVKALRSANRGTKFDVNSPAKIWRRMVVG